MKNKGFICVILILILLVCPVAALGNKNTLAKNDGGQAPQSSADSDPDTILVMSSSNKKISKIDLFEYVVGAVSAEMPPTYHTEALKAQAAACYTYALKTRESQQKNPDKALGGAHITDDSTEHQGYIDRNARKDKWGDKYETYEDKIESAVKEVFGKKITYDGELITAAFHAISAGNTFSAEEVWGKAVPYLKSVNSAGDKLSPDYSKTVVMSEAEFKKAAKKLDGAELGEQAKTFAQESETSDSGYVTAQKIGGKAFTGIEVREALGLRSASFKIEYADGSFRITTLGYGHGVGMSQYGADYMARQGSTWQEIIKHYYTGVEIV